MSKAKTAFQIFSGIKMTADPVTSKLLIAAGKAVGTGSEKRFAKIAKALSEHKAKKNVRFSAWVDSAGVKVALLERASALRDKALATKDPIRVSDNLWVAGVLVGIAAHIDAGYVAKAVRFISKMNIEAADLPRAARKFFKDFI